MDFDYQEIGVAFVFNQRILRELLKGLISSGPRRLSEARRILSCAPHDSFRCLQP
jgi:hypothetical protein